ncbi:MotA/TolQ/ExbB proton channel family protein [Alteromonas sp. a30]|uniref:MotA/TolQ/ExbB proton channel family protein n=1 Tax=Alteromonas sp. a30 TaxID=2730917 RepID=UPI002281C21A|nr:MotA/TolQ/ExbB proton channel family protein [Alteromonas sp. a30]MCY7296906.1 MotA/TolQ/ExbB proton channel family protein [Alteromonas sp. a30]
MSNKHDASMNPDWKVQLGGFLAIVAVVHFFYQGIILPSADAAIAAFGAGATTNGWVILKDFEQQICITLGLYCLGLMLFKYLRLFNQEPLYTYDYLEDHDKNESLDVDAALTRLESSEFSETSSMATWIDCLRRFRNTGNVQHAADAIRDSMESLGEQLESGNSMIRYFIWAIPSVGFVGTVRGIGSALAKAEEAVSGDISGMVDKLGVAFNSTLVSLVISIILMFALHNLNNRQEQMVIKTRKNCEKRLLTHLHK